MSKENSITEAENSNKPHSSKLILKLFFNQKSQFNTILTYQIVSGLKDLPLILNFHMKTTSEIKVKKIRNPKKVRKKIFIFKDQPLSHLCLLIVVMFILFRNGQLEKPLIKNLEIKMKMKTKKMLQKNKKLLDLVLMFLIH